MRFIAIDPGITGGIAILDDTTNKLTLHTIPLIAKGVVDIAEIYRILKEATTEEHIVCLEDVHAIPGTGSGSNFKFGWIKGVKEGIIAGLGTRYVLVAPKTWQKEMWQGVPLMKNSSGKNDTKGMSLVAAKRWFPGESFLPTARSSKPHDGLVDAALMAGYLQIRYGKNNFF